MLHMKGMMIAVAVVALLIGSFLGYVGARAKLRPMLLEKDMQIGKLQTDLTNEQVKSAKALEEEKTAVQGKGFIMKNGKMMVEENGNESLMEKDAVLDDGTSVSTKGVVTKKDGTKMTLSEGQSIWMDGTLMQEGKKDK